MRIGEFESNSSIIKEIGSRIQRTRISQNKTQNDIANYSGVSIAAIKAIEGGKSCSLDTLIKILKALGICSNLNDLIPSYDLAPYDITQSGKVRQRVHKRKEKTIIIWGEDK